MRLLLVADLSGKHGQVGSLAGEAHLLNDNASAKLVYAKTVFTSFAKQLDARTGLLPGPVPSIAGPALRLCYPKTLR